MNPFHAPSHCGGELSFYQSDESPQVIAYIAKNDDEYYTYLTLEQAIQARDWLNQFITAIEKEIKR